MPIGIPGSLNSLGSLLFRGTRMNRVADQSPFLKDLNCQCFDPYSDLVLNPKAWVDVGPGEWGSSAGYYNDYRQARRPDEQISLGRTFRIREKMTFGVRGEFFNAFNRIVYAAPSSFTPTASTTKDNNGLLTGGFGYINALSSGTPRNGQVVIRFGF
jgi:hypothetical protein